MTGRGRHREYYAGALVALIGVGAIYKGQQYGIGGLSDMGSGYFPVMLGAGMVIMGALIAASRSTATDAHALRPPDWRGALAIVAAVILFIALADRAGLAPATFACVFVGALGTSTTRLIEAAALAIAVTIFGVLLFRYGLQVEFPIIRGVLQ